MKTIVNIAPMTQYRMKNLQDRDALCLKGFRSN